MSRIITGDALVAAFREKGWFVGKDGVESARHTKLDLDEFTILPRGDQSLVGKFTTDNTKLTDDLYAWAWSSNALVRQYHRYSSHSSAACYVLKKRTPLWHELE